MRTVATISSASSYFRVYGFYGDFYLKVIGPFIKAHLYKHKQENIPGSRKKKWVVSHVFARSLNDRQEYRLPRSLMEEFINYAEYCGYKRGRIEMQEEPFIKAVPAKFKLKKGMETPRPNQDEWINYQLGDGAIKVNEAATGNGKALTHSSKIRIPGGWTTMGKIKVGDEVIAWDGTTTTVTGVYPQGIIPTYRVYFEDGRFVDASLDHLWKVYIDGRAKVIDTEDVMDKLRFGLELFVPLFKPSEDPDIDLPEDPYEYAFMATGSVRSGRCQLDGVYLQGSAKQRLAVLQGAMDSHGKIVDGRIIFEYPHIEICYQVAYLVRSLGGKATYRDGGRYQEFNQGIRHVEVVMPDPEVLFTLQSRKKQVSVFPKIPDMKLKIVRISRMHDEHCSCIAIAHRDHLFVTNDYIVTHNTYMSLYTMVKLGVRTVITIQPRYITTWVRDISKTLDIEKDDVLIWEFSDLPQLGKLYAKGTLKANIIIIPMSRISSHLRKEKEDSSLTNLDEIFRQIGAGFRITDESHESFHEVTLSMMFGNFPKHLLLSATLTADDPTANKLYKIVLPPSIRLKEAEAENYIDIRPVLYRINTNKYRINTQQFGQYNDLAYEQSLLRSSKLTDFYFRLADFMFKHLYLDLNRREGTKCIIFFSRINMCETMLGMFRKKYPGMDFETFLGTKDKDKLKYLKHEIVITTPGSCGTGKDIPGLMTNLCLHTVSSTQKNKQIIGRLRDIGKEFNHEIVPTFGFAVCEDIPKHREYYHKRKLAFEKKEKSWKALQSDCWLE